MSYQDILLLLNGIRELLETLQKYLLNPAHLIFDPHYIYMSPGKNSFFFCYLPRMEETAKLQTLTEFILKHLDHEDRQAVVLGYHFFQKAGEENFSLQQTLRDILMQERDNENENEKEKEAETRNIFEENRDFEEEYEVIHKERERKSGRSTGERRLFQFIHPFIFVSCLILMSGIGAAYYLDYIGVRETGGLFFLVAAVEILINKYWRKSVLQRIEQENRWSENEDEELYQLLKEEMYLNEEPEDTFEETTYLTAEKKESGLMLVWKSGGVNGRLPDIRFDRVTQMVGKIRGESDIILDSPTVSRVHAQLECRNAKYYVKDMNSKNGTFCNERRLQPQEQCQFREGDKISFADVEFVAVKTLYFARNQ